MGQPVTTNPILIMVINMTVVFAVLYGLSLIIRLIKVIDPTQKKSIAKTEPAPTAAPVAAAPAAPAEADQGQLIAVLAAAIAATGYGAARIMAVRPVIGKGWAQAARLETVQSRNRMY
ncbi:OadG family protein [Anaeroselena agilis]|uniref:OadG family protein n=1 Tax=Anaeroselena agilis TaxID=3063788 RepID=A0ABU3NZR6_9FIRM|nr:OadG family protein [Selenomonadales bacterium 4137-cl]